MKQLRGITWNHSRGYLPMVATAQRYCELHPDVEISWEKRSLQAFGDYPIQKLTDHFDLLVIDHPFVGYAATHPVLLPLDDYLAAEFLADQACNSVGASYASYVYDGHLWALPIDAATPVSASRPDLLQRIGVGAPANWDELLALAKEGWVAFPAVPTDTLMHFYMLCVSQGEAPFAEEGRVISEAMGLQALSQLRQLAQLCTPEIFGWNPFRTFEALASRDDLAYCPFAYGYSNYARDGYARNLLTFGDVPSVDGKNAASTTLGGTGLAISTCCQEIDVAVDYAQFVASSNCQRQLFVQNGGQPGHRAAWLDEEANRITHNFFRNTLPTLDRAWLRPRHCGYADFQDRAWNVVGAYLKDGGDARSILTTLLMLCTK